MASILPFEKKTFFFFFFFKVVRDVRRHVNYRTTYITKEKWRDFETLNRNSDRMHEPISVIFNAKCSARCAGSRQYHFFKICWNSGPSKILRSCWGQEIYKAFDTVKYSFLTFLRKCLDVLIWNLVQTNIKYFYRCFYNFCEDWLTLTCFRGINRSNTFFAFLTKLIEIFPPNLVFR